jgi:hypothetical protein
MLKRLIRSTGKCAQMADENIYAFLARRERELTHQIAALKGQLAQTRGQLAQREHELVEVMRMRAASALAGDASIPNLLQQSNHLGTLLHERFVGSEPAGDAMLPDMGKRYAEMTIKELVIQALLDHFPKGGTTIEIRDFIQDAYTRDIMPASLRPQMHRLKADGVLGQDPSTDTWNFRDGKRSLYAMYDHPRTRKAMKELQDSEPGLRDTIEAAHEDHAMQALQGSKRSLRFKTQAELKGEPNAAPTPRQQRFYGGNDENK